MNTLSSKFKNLFGRMPAVISSAPGRINIIGEHTDYNGGYVLPAAIDRRIHFLVAPRTDDKVVLWAENFGEQEDFSIKNLAPPSSGIKWSNYVQGIFWVLEKENHSLGGLDGFIFGDIPLGSGLSSSAALEVSVANALNNLFQLSLPLEKIPLIAQRAESEFVGVDCGLMDQFISVFGRKDEALFLDCATLAYEYVPLSLEKNKLKILVIDSRVHRELASSEYNRRREECCAVVKILGREGIDSLRDISLQLLNENEEELGDVLFRRARHVITENARVIESKQALKTNDYLRLGELLFGSHESLRDDYEVSCPELDLLFTLGKEYEGCLGARLTGAGFGGSGIVLIEEEKMSGFKNKIESAFAGKRFKVPHILKMRIGDGAVVK
jgi:galactokinase